MKRYIRESNLIEGIDDLKEDAQSMKAWNYLMQAPLINEKVLLKTHKLITTNQLEHNESGFYRTVDVAVGGRLCPAPFLAKQLIYNFLMDLLQKWENLDPIEMHVRFELIHPFVDGNGRTGRMLLWWHEKKRGKQPTLFLNSEKHDKYYPLFSDGDLK